MKGIFLSGERATSIEQPCSMGLLGGQSQGMSSSSERQMRGWRFATRGLEQGKQGDAPWCSPGKEEGGVRSEVLWTTELRSCSSDCCHIRTKYSSNCYLTCTTDHTIFLIIHKRRINLISYMNVSKIIFNFGVITIPRFFVSRPISPSMYIFGRTHVLIFHKFSMLVTFVNEKSL